MHPAGNRGYFAQFVHLFAKLPIEFAKNHQTRRPKELHCRYLMLIVTDNVGKLYLLAFKRAPLRFCITSVAAVWAI